MAELLGVLSKTMIFVSKKSPKGYIRIAHLFTTPGNQIRAFFPSFLAMIAPPRGALASNAQPTPHKLP